MPTLDRALEALAIRGESRGSEVLIERLEMQLGTPDPAPRLRAVHAAERDPVVWRRGLVIAVATSFVVLTLGAVGALVVGLVRAASREVVAPVTTTQTLPGQTPTPERLFGGMVVREGEVTGIFQNGDLVPLVEGECCVRGAVSDLGTGVVFQRDEDAVLWAKGVADSRDQIPVTIFESGPGERVTLEGVSVIGGEPTAIVVRFEATAEGDRATLTAVGLVSGNQTDVFVLDDGDVITDRASFGGDTYLVSLSDADGTWFEFRDEAGAVVTVAGNPHPVPAGTVVSQGVLSRDGEVIVFLERQPADVAGGPADLVTFDLERGVELTRHNLANFGDRIIAFDGDRVIVDRQQSNPELPAIMVAVHLGEGAIYTSQGSFSAGSLGDQ